MVPVRLDGHGSITVSPPDPCPDGRESPECLAGRVPISVAADTDDRHLRLKLLEKGGGRRGSRAMMPDLEQIRRTELPCQCCFGDDAGVAHQQGAECSPAHLEHGRVLIEVLAGVRPHSGRVQQAEAHTIEFPSISCHHRVPAHTASGQRLQPRAVTRLVEGFSRFKGDPDRQCAAEYCRPTYVIPVRVGEHQGLDAPRPEAAKQRQHDPLPCVPAVIRRTGVHHDPVPGRGPDQGGVTLPDIREN